MSGQPLAKQDSTAAGFKLGQRPCLDGLRGLAAMAVVLSHFHLLTGGLIGVEILFVLSGFLITILLIEEHERTGEISLARFFRRRFLRVLPPLFALLIIVSVVNVSLGKRTAGEMLRESAAAGLFVANQGASFGIPMPDFGHTWTLAIEVQFYLLWPVAFCWLLRAKVRRERIIAILAALIVGSMALRLGLFAFRPPSGPIRQAYLYWLFMGLDTHCDTLLIGCLAGALLAWNRLSRVGFHSPRAQGAGWLSLILLLYILACCNQEQHAFYCGLFTVTGLLVAGLIVVLTMGPSRSLCRLFECRPLVALGRISYALYLVHIPIHNWLPPQSASTAVLGMTLSVAAAVVSFYVLERPFIRTKKRPPVVAALLPEPIPATGLQRAA